MLREVQGGKEGSPSKKVAQRLSSSPHAPAPCSLAVRMLFECWVACQGSLMTCKENVAQRLWLASNTPWSLLSCSENVAQILRSSPQAPCLSHTARRWLPKGCVTHHRLPALCRSMDDQAAAYMPGRESLAPAPTLRSSLPHHPPDSPLHLPFLFLEWLYMPQIPRPDSLCDCMV